MTNKEDNLIWRLCIAASIFFATTVMLVTCKTREDNKPKVTTMQTVAGGNCKCQELAKKEDCTVYFCHYRDGIDSRSFYWTICSDGLSGTPDVASVAVR